MEGRFDLAVAATISASQAPLRLRSIEPQFSPSLPYIRTPGKLVEEQGRRYNAVNALNSRAGTAVDVKDCNGAILKEGDSVTLIKDLKVKGSSVTLKRGTRVKNIHLTDDPAEIECNAEKVKGLVLRTEFLKKA